MISPLTQKEFEGKAVLITGASSGLGRSLALQLSTCAVRALVLSARREDALQQVANECQQQQQQQRLQQATAGASLDSKKANSPTPLQIHIIPCDLGRPDDVTSLAAKALEVCEGRIDVLINNGGVSSRSRFVDTQLSVDEHLMQVNFFSGAALAKSLVPPMIQHGRGGKIIWISSVQGLVGIPLRTSYAASKFAVQGYCEALRAELALEDNISVHVASPGYIRTNLSQSAMVGDGTLHGHVDATTAQGSNPDDVATSILDKVARGQVEFVVAATPAAHVAIWLRFLCPALLRYMLIKRYQKSFKKEKED